MNTHSHSTPQPQTQCSVYCSPSEPSSAQRILPEDEARWLVEALEQIRVFPKSPPQDDREIKMRARLAAMLAARMPLHRYPADADEMLAWQLLRLKCLIIGFDLLRLHHHMPRWLLADIDVACEVKPELVKPPLERRKNCSVGDIVTLAFVGDLGEGEEAECLHVEIDERLSNGGYRGRLVTESASFEDLPYGQEIKFLPEHIMAIPKDQRHLAAAEISRRVKATLEALSCPAIRQRFRSSLRAIKPTSRRGMKVWR